MENIESLRYKELPVKQDIMATKQAVLRSLAA
jgi:hypothetical protein